MWIFDQTPWADADQSLSIRTLLLTDTDMGTLRAIHEALLRCCCPPSSALTGIMLSQWRHWGWCHPGGRGNWWCHPIFPLKTDDLF